MKKLVSYERLLVLILVIFFIWIVIAFIQNFKTIENKKIQTNELSSVTASKNIKSFLIKGSIPYWDEENAADSFKKNISKFNYINLFLYYLGRDGEVVRYSYAKEDKELINLAHKNNVLVSAVITNLPEDPASWSSKRVEDVIESNELTEKHIKNIISVLNEFGFDGVIIDYESLESKNKNKYSEFIKKLSIELKKEDKILTTVLHPKTGENVPGESISKYQDWIKIAEYSDQIQIMGYSEHTDEDEPGPIASVGWVSKIISYTQSLGIPAEKIFLGIPLYGYDWNKDSDKAAEGLTYKEIMNLSKEKKAKIEFDLTQKSPMFKYDSHEVWFENSESVYEKARLAKDANFAGVTFWRLGDEDQKVWKVLQKLNSN